jgi:hypothetical protein
MYVYKVNYIKKVLYSLLCKIIKLIYLIILDNEIKRFNRNNYKKRLIQKANYLSNMIF